MTVRTWHVEIPTEECTELVARTPLGRLGVIVDGRPEIFPVNHVFDRETGCVVFPTNVGTKLHAALDWPWVAFEVDGVDAGGDGGWSVMVVGRAEEVDDPAVVARAARLRKAIWGAGPSVRWVRVFPAKMTGRRISATEL